MEKHGIDVSHYQLDIDWKKVSDQGIDFTIMKCMYEAQSHRKDECFEENYRCCGIYGIARGVYIFIASASIGDPVGDAKALLRHLADRPLEYGIWLDFESAALRAQGIEKIRDLAYLYARQFRAVGYHVGIYCNKDWYDNVIHEDLKRDFEFWIARYPKKDEGKYNPNSKLRPTYKDAVAWQYSSKGHIDGIKTAVDLDVDFDGVVNLIGDSPKKTNEEIVMEVLKGIWGNGQTRKRLLTRAGYNYEEIQRKINGLLSQR